VPTAPAHCSALSAGPSGCAGRRRDRHPRRVRL